MKLFFILFAFLWIPVGIVAQTSEDRAPQIFHVGLSSNAFDNFNLNDALAALRVWTDTVIREQNLKEKAEVNFFNSYEALSHAYKNDLIDAVSISVEDCMRLGLTPEFVYLPSREDGFHVRYAIIVHRNSNIQDLGILRDKKLGISEGQQMLLARLWLKSVMAEHVPGIDSSSYPNLTSVDSPSKAILQVFFRQADAAIVTNATFELACELNPQLRKDILVLDSSTPFVSSFFIFRPSWQSPSRERLESAIMALHTTPGGRQVLNVFGSSRLEKHPGSVLDSTREFLIKNQKLIQNGSFKWAQ